VLVFTHLATYALDSKKGAEAWKLWNSPLLTAAYHKIKQKQKNCTNRRTFCWVTGSPGITEHASVIPLELFPVHITRTHGWRTVRTPLTSSGSAPQVTAAWRKSHDTPPDRRDGLPVLLHTSLAAPQNRLGHTMGPCPPSRPASHRSKSTCRTHKHTHPHCYRQRDQLKLVLYHGNWTTRKVMIPQDSRSTAMIVSVVNQIGFPRHDVLDEDFAWGGRPRPPLGRNRGAAQVSDESDNCTLGAFHNCKLGWG
jgi:hypothetical protein